MSEFKRPTICDCNFCVKPDWLTAEEHIHEVGVFLGYPKCCVNEYIDNMRNNTSFSWKRHLAAQYKQSSSGGFIPCTKHAERIVDQGKSISRIFRNRICSSSFPYSSPSQFKKYLKKIKSKYIKNNILKKT